MLYLLSRFYYVKELEMPVLFGSTNVGGNFELRCEKCGRSVGSIGRDEVVRFCVFLAEHEQDVLCFECEAQSDNLAVSTAQYQLPTLDFLRSAACLSIHISTNVVNVKENEC